MAVVVSRSKPVAQVYRLFYALIALLALMAVALGVAQWRSGRPSGSPYGALTAVAPVPAADPGPLAAGIAAPAPVLPASEPRPAAGSPPAVPATDPARPQPRVIALGKASPDTVQPAPAAAVSAALAAAAAPPRPIVAAAPPADQQALASPAAPAPAAAPTAPAPDKANEPTDGRLININTASVEELNHIPGAGLIGRTIVRHRPYASLQDLIDHRVLRASEYARIRGKLTTN